jgi:valyl-tRNA synthetase
LIKIFVYLLQDLKILKMTDLEAFEIVKIIISNIRKKKQNLGIKNGASLIINLDNHPHVDIILQYNDVIKKMCKLKEIIYNSELDKVAWKINFDEKKIIFL